MRDGLGLVVVTCGIFFSSRLACAQGAVPLPAVAPVTVTATEPKPTAMRAAGANQPRKPTTGEKTAPERESVQERVDKYREELDTRTDESPKKPSKRATVKPPKVTVLIATVPNPEAHSLGLFFDRTLESIERAFADAGFRLVHSYFPWCPPSVSEDDEKVAEGSGELKAPSGNKKSKPQPVCDVARRDHLGFLFFWPVQPGPVTQGAVVLLVPETPTEGIDREGWKAAAVIAGKISGPSTNETPAQTFILGPNFSGSFDSLAGVLNENANAPDQTWVASGTATSYSQIKAFQEKHYHFRTLTATDQDAMKFFQLVTRRYMGSRDPLIVLTEDQTAYGDIKPTDGGYRIGFPRGVWQLRNLTSSGSAGGSSPFRELYKDTHRIVPLNLHDPASPRDNLESFAPAITPVSQESVLLQIVSTLKHHKEKIVGIFATDPLDTLFLAEYVRRQAPTVRIVTFSSDLLQIHADQWRGLTGILNVTTYPLFIRYQNWMAEKRFNEFSNRKYFPSGLAEGTYNAATLLLKTMCFRVQAVDLRQRDLEFDSPERQQQAVPMMLTVVGKDSIWPVAWDPGGASRLGAYFENRDGPHRPDANLPRKDTSGGLEMDHSQRFWECLYIACCAGLVFLLWGLLRRRFVRANGTAALQARSSFLDGFALDLDEEAVLRRALYIFLILTIAGLAFTLLSITLFVPGFYLSLVSLEWKDAGWCRILSAILGALLLIVAPLCAAVQWVSGEWNRRARTKAVAIFAFALVPVLIGCACLCEQWSLRNAKQDSHSPLSKPSMLSQWNQSLVSPDKAAAGTWLSQQDGEFEAFVFFRMGDLFSGVNALWPILFSLVGLGWYACWNLHTSTSWVRRRRVLKNALLEQVFTPWSNAWDVYTSPPLLALPAGSRLVWHAIALSATCGTYAVLKPFKHLETFEPKIIEWAMLGLPLLLVAALADALLRMIGFWQCFREGLERLDETPLRRAFLLLPKEFGWWPVVSRGWRAQASPLWSRCMESLRLSQSERLLELPEWVKQEGAGGMFRPSEDVLWDSQEKMNHIAHSALDKLKTQWSTASESDSLVAALKNKPGDAYTDQEKSSLFHSRSRMILEELVALRIIECMQFMLIGMRSMFLFLAGGFVLLAMAVNSYPFRMAQVLNQVLLAVFVVLGFSLVWVFVGMSRDGILSRLSNTEVGRLDWEFFRRTLSYGILPLMAVLASQFPEFSDRVWSLLRVVSGGE